MSYLEQKVENGERQVPIYQDVHETAQGGFGLDVTGLTAGDVIPAGTPMTFDEATRKAKKAAATGAGTEADPYVSDAKGLLYEDVVVEDGAPISIVTRGTVYARRVNGVNFAEHEADLPLILFSESY